MSKLANEEMLVTEANMTKKKLSVREARCFCFQQRPLSVRIEATLKDTVPDFRETGLNCFYSKTHFILKL